MSIDNVPHYDLVSDLSSENVSSIKDFFSFRLLIAKGIIRGIFFLGFIIQIIFGLFIIFNDSSFFLYGLGFIFFGWIPLRLSCELIIIFFRIHDELVTLNENMSKKTP